MRNLYTLVTFVPGLALIAVGPTDGLRGLGVLLVLISPPGLIAVALCTGLWLLAPGPDGSDHDD